MSVILLVVTVIFIFPHLLLVDLYESCEPLQLSTVSFEVDGLSWYKSCILQGFGQASTIFKICSPFSSTLLFCNAFSYPSV